jgi:predicted enzyme related to lactoylglutathione lyase
MSSKVVNSQAHMQREFRFVMHSMDYPSTVAFYRDGLELPIIDGWDRGPDDKGTLFGAASGIIEVIAPRSGGESVSLKGGFVLVEVEDVNTLYHRIREKGLPIKRELKDMPWGHRDFMLTDPNGIVVGLFSKIKSQGGI